MDDERWRANPRLAITRTPGRVVLLDLDRPADPPVILQGTAAALWDHACTGAARTVLHQEGAVLGLSPDVVDRFIDDLAAARLIRPQ